MTMIIITLVLWDPQALEIVGAYRFIPTAEQVASKGLNGIYSQSLFHYGHQMDPILAQGVELGRSFIQPAYWGKRGLDYLWLGIGAYLAKYPQTRYLFGPVSISGECRCPPVIYWWRLLPPVKLLPGITAGDVTTSVSGFAARCVSTVLRR